MLIASLIILLGTLLVVLGVVIADYFSRADES